MYYLIWTQKLYKKHVIFLTHIWTQKLYKKHVIFLTHIWTQKLYYIKNVLFYYTSMNTDLYYKLESSITFSVTNNDLSKIKTRD